MSALRVALAVVVAAALPASATTIDPMSWLDLLDRSSFAGVVECTRAGGIVAEYQVIESWKGPPVGTTLRIRVATNYWEPQYPLSLVGERWVVTAFESPPSTMMSTTSGSPVPLWWRHVKTDYELPLFQGRALASGAKESGGFHGLQAEAASLDELRRDALAFLAKSPDARELERLKANALKYLPKATRTALSRTRDVPGFVRKLVALQVDGAKNEPYMLYRVLERGGGAVTLQAARDMRDAGFPGDTEMYDGLTEALGGSTEVEAPRSEKPTPEPSPSDLADMKLRLLESSDVQKVNDVLQPLLAADPGVVAAWLQKWTNTGSDWRSASVGYEVGSWFGHACKVDRVANLKRLLTAKDLYVQVAAAVYLSFDDVELARAELTKRSELPGDPGAWAALRRARMGDATAMPRVLQLFREPGADSMEGVPHRNFQKVALELLSNSAAASGVTAPPDVFAVEGKARAKQVDALEHWWSTNEAKIRLLDPWLPELAERRAD